MYMISNICKTPNVTIHATATTDDVGIEDANITYCITTDDTGINDALAYAATTMTTTAITTAMTTATTTTATDIIPAVYSFTWSRYERIKVNLHGLSTSVSHALSFEVFFVST